MTTKSDKKKPSIGQYVPPEEQIGERIRQRREDVLGLNFEEFARLTTSYDHPDYVKGLTPTMLRRYETGVDGRPVMPGARELRILCEALDMSADWLILGVDDKAEGAQAKELLQNLNSALSAVSSWALNPGNVDPYKNFERQEKLRRARNPPKDE